MNNDTELLNLCKNIKQLRENNKLSKKEMAKKLGIGTKSLTAIENGILPPRIGCSMLFEIQRNFGICPKTMFSDTYNKKGCPL